MITAVAFSRDRACQLDLLLASLERNGRMLFNPVYVLYRATTAAHDDAYLLCQERFPGVVFVPDGDETPADLLSDALLATFFTDDSVLYRPLPSRPLFDLDVLCFSLRLGWNTRWCYPLGREQRSPGFVKTGGMLRWEWKDADGDFGYPASVDGHVFRARNLRRALMGCPGDANPNRLEEHLVEAFRDDRKTMMASYDHSCLVGVPANVVSSTHRNRHDVHGQHPDALCAAYLSGRRISLDDLDFADVRGAHQDIDLVLS
jgi:hypothetical protein